MAEGKSNSVTICWCFGRNIGTWFGIRTLTVDGRLKNASVTPVAIVHPWVLTNFSCNIICTRPFLFAASNSILLDLGGFFIFLFRHTRYRERSSTVVVTSCKISCLSTASFGRSSRQVFVPAWNYWGSSSILGERNALQTWRWISSPVELLVLNYAQYQNLL